MSVPFNCEYRKKEPMKFQVSTGDSYHSCSVLILEESSGSPSSANRILQHFVNSNSTSTALLFHGMPGPLLIEILLALCITAGLLFLRTLRWRGVSGISTAEDLSMIDASSSRELKHVTEPLEVSSLMKLRTGWKS